MVPAAMATRLQAQRLRQLTGRALRKAGTLLEEPSADARPGGHPRAESVFRRMHRYHELTEYDSRLSELIDFFGWETGCKGHACRRWFFHDDPKFWKFLEKMGLKDPE